MAGGQCDRLGDGGGLTVPLLDRALPWVLGLGVLVAALAGLVWLHQSHARAVIASAVAAERASWQDTHTKALVTANLEGQREATNAAIAALEAQIELSTLRQDLERDRALSRAHAGSLQRTIAEFRDRAAREAAGAGPGSVADGATRIADALGECSERRAEVAAVADRLSVQVTGLQRYITDVVGPMCISGQSEAVPAEP